MAKDPHCRVKRYSFKREWKKGNPIEVTLKAFSDMDDEARRVGAVIVDKWYDIDRNMEWVDLAYGPPPYRPTTVTFQIGRD